jgi:hypothetical protein
VPEAVAKRLASWSNGRRPPDSARPPGAIRRGWRLPACLVVAYDVADERRPFMLMDVVEAIEPSVATLRDRRRDVRELLEQA